MAHWAEINDNNIVTRVVVMNNDALFEDADKTYSSIISG